MFGDVPVTGAEPVHVFIRQPLAGGDDGVAQNAAFVIVPGPRQASSFKGDIPPLPWSNGRTERSICSFPNICRCGR